MSEAPERAPEQLTGHTAYMAELDRIIDHCRYVSSAPPRAFGEGERGLLRFMAAMLLSSTDLASTGFVRARAQDWSQAGKAQREAL